MDFYGIDRINSWKDNFENLRVLITMFDADPNAALSTMLTNWTTVEQFKEVFKFVKAVQPYFKLEESLLHNIIKFYLRPNNAEKYVEIIKFILPEYKSLSATTIGKAFSTPALERDLDLLWSFLIKLDPKTINDIVNEEDNETLLDILLRKHFSVPEDTPALQAQRKERFLLKLLSQNPNVNIKADGYSTSAQTAFKEDISSTLTDNVLLEILNRADLTIKGEAGWTLAHLAFYNKNLSERVLLAILKLKPDFNILSIDKIYTPISLAFQNPNITEKILLEILKQEDIDIGLKYRSGSNILIKGLHSNRTNIVTEKVMFKLLDKGGEHIYDINDDGLDAMIIAFLNKEISDNVLSYIISAHHPINLDKKYSYYPPVKNSGAKVSKTLRDIIKDAGKGYLLNETRPVKSIQPAPSSSPRHSSRKMHRVASEGFT